VRKKNLISFSHFSSRPRPRTSTSLPAFSALSLSFLSNDERRALLRRRPFAAARLDGCSARRGLCVAEKGSAFLLLLLFCFLLSPPAAAEAERKEKRSPSLILSLFLFSPKNKPKNPRSRGPQRGQKARQDHPSLKPGREDERERSERRRRRRRSATAWRINKKTLPLYLLSFFCRFFPPFPVPSDLIACVTENRYCSIKEKKRRRRSSSIRKQEENETNDRKKNEIKKSSRYFLSRALSFSFSSSTFLTTASTRAAPAFPGPW